MEKIPGNLFIVSSQEFLFQSDVHSTVILQLFTQTGTISSPFPVISDLEIASLVQKVPEPFVLCQLQNKFKKSQGI